MDTLTIWPTNGFLQAKSHREYQNFTRWPKYTKTHLSADQLFLVAVAQQNASPVLLILFYKRALKNNDTTHFINFIEHTPLPDGADLATFEVCSLYTNIPQEEGIEVVCQYYQEHYQWKTPIPTQSLGDLMRLILKENF